MTTEIEQEIAPHVKTMQVICVALAIGPVVFAGILLFGGLGHEGEPKPDFMTTIGLMMAGMALVISPFLRKVAANPAKVPAEFRGSDIAREAAAYQMGLIAASALNEGAAFTNLMAFMMEGSPWSLALAALMVVVNVMKFPTVGGVAAWITDRQRLQREEEQFAG